MRIKFLFHYRLFSAPVSFTASTKSSRHARQTRAAGQIRPTLHPSWHTETGDTYPGERNRLRAAACVVIHGERAGDVSARRGMERDVNRATRRRRKTGWTCVGLGKRSTYGNAGNAHGSRAVIAHRYRLSQARRVDGLIAEINAGCGQSGVGGRFCS